MDKRRILIVGGGAAGIMAALFAARAGAGVTVLERNEKLGKKLYITGKGRCNLTNACDMSEFMSCILRNPRFLYAAFATLDNAGLIRLIESLGVPTKTERGARVFPVSDKSSDILGALTRELARLGVDVRLNSRVDSLITIDGVCAGAKLVSGEEVFADAVILATGGLSYPATGSTGDGHKLSQALGHDVVAPMPALVPINTRETWVSELTGLTLKNVKLSAFMPVKGKEKRIYSEQGELLFTHFGISGPLTLTLSSLVPADASCVRLEIDLKPALDEQTLEQRLLRDFKEMSRSRLITVMDGLEPHSLALKLLEIIGLSPNAAVNSVTQAQRRSIINILKHLPLTIASPRGFEEAVITRGGVSVKDVNPSTMESKRIKGLYFAGELMDVDAMTGGFNLQIAFSTGALAGVSAAKGE